MSIRVGFGYDSHRFSSSRRLILGGIEIPFEKGLEGHSDADALTHAIIDALLGAAGLGDIGTHFPDTEPSYKNISSLVLLKKVLTMVRQEGYDVLNVDVTIIAEQPKLAPYISKIQHQLYEVGLRNVNIKAKTNEKMGFIGRAEGIAVMAVVLLNLIK